MQYFDGTRVALGDVVSVPIPSGTARARVVMLGEDYSHLNIDPKFLSWVESKKILEVASVVVEWLDKNPYAHNDPKYAPVGNFLFTRLDEHIKPIRG